jgi:hypothetical protein
MILDLERGFGGFVHVSPQPMNHAVEVLRAEANNESAANYRINEGS